MKLATCVKGVVKLVLFLNQSPPMGFPVAFKRMGGLEVLLRYYRVQGQMKNRVK
mgnify:FL=1